MLKRLKINNFKSWSEADVKFGRITGLFGTNSSGKSSFVQFLLLLKQTRESSDRAAALDLNGRLVELGTAEDVIHAHDSKLRMAFDLEFEHLNRLEDKALMRLIDSANEAASNRAVRARLQVYKGAFRSRSLTHCFGDAKFRLKRTEKSDTDFDLLADIPGRIFSFERTRGRRWPLPGPVMTYRFPDQARAYFTNSGFLADLEAAFEAALDKIYYLGPLRDHPKRDYLWSRSRPRDVGARGERTVDAIIAAEDAGEKQNTRWRGRLLPFSHVVAHWLRKLELVDAFRVVEVAKGSNRWETKVRTAGGAEVMLTDVGFGVSQVLPVIVLLHYVPKGSTVLLEQPEIHLHPLAQASLADVIVNAATHRKVQVIVESHSEHLLLRLQRRIAERGIKSEDVALYFCDVSRSASRVQPLDLDIFGNIQNWPDRFMGDAFTETAEAELARLKRMKTARDDSLGG